MTISSDTRRLIRQRYGFTCAYCGVSEADAGSELEIDHFHPVKHGGSDELNNLIYACPACNRNKASFWPSPNTPTHMRLLHPLHDESHLHIVSLQDGQLAGLTPRGWFHIEWLHLNRPQLVLLRQKQIRNESTQKLLKQIQGINQQLYQRVAEQEKELEMLRQEIRRLMSNN